jgi:YVTN family beta-propeller protein
MQYPTFHLCKPIAAGLLLCSIAIAGFRQSTPPAGILVDPDGSRAFIGCTADNYVAVIDLKTLTVSGHIDVGGGPDGLAWAARP